MYQDDLWYVRVYWYTLLWLYCSHFTGAFRYAVVHFKDDNTVAVVYSGWVTEKGKYCYWPIKGNATDMARNFAPLSLHFRRFELTRVLYETGKHSYDMCTCNKSHFASPAALLTPVYHVTNAQFALCCYLFQMTGRKQGRRRATRRPTMTFIPLHVKRMRMTSRRRKNVNWRK